MKKLLLSLFILIALIIGTLYATDNDYLLKAVRTTWLRGQSDVGIYDYTVQATRAIPTGQHQPWTLHPQYNQIPLSEEILSLHQDRQTTAYLVIKEGQILSEHYFLDGKESEQTALWSISKTYTSFAVLKAIEDGLIESVDDPVSKYLPEWKEVQNPPLTLRHLASMSAALGWDEMDHSPFALIARFNFHKDLERLSLTELKSIGNPGEVQHYNSGATQLLGIVLKRVLGEKSLSDYLSEKFWQPLGCKYVASYILDSEKNGTEKSFGGMVASARDVSRLGQAILDEGEWRGKQILSPKDIALIKQIPYNNRTYTYGMWTGVYKGERFYFQAGFGGQLCIGFPAHNLLVTRMGHKAAKKKNIEDIPMEVEHYIGEAIRIANLAEK